MLRHTIPSSVGLLLAHTHSPALPCPALLPPLLHVLLCRCRCTAVPAAAVTLLPLPLLSLPLLCLSLLSNCGHTADAAAAITYSRGDNERWRRQLAAEAALIFADMPPFGGGAAAAGGGSRAASVAASSAAAGSYRPFTANMDIDSVAFLRSSQGAGYGGGRWRRGGDSLYGVTPISHASPLRRRDSGSSLARSVASGGVVGGSSLELGDADGADWLLGPVEVPRQVGQQAEV